jgi:hypothetical protein
MSLLCFSNLRIVKITSYSATIPVAGQRGNVLRSQGCHSLQGQCMEQWWNGDWKVISGETCRRSCSTVTLSA